MQNEQIDEIRRAQQVNEAVADTPKEIEINGKTFKLNNFTISRIIKIDKAILEFMSAADEYSSLREELNEGLVDVDDAKDRFADVSNKIADKLSSVVAMILFDDGDTDENKVWVQDNVTPQVGIRIMKTYQEQSSITPFLREVLASKQF